MSLQPRVPVVAMDGTPLMPTTPAHARVMLRDKVARPLRNKLGLFYIQMLIPVGTATQPMALALDPGSKHEGAAVASHLQIEATAQVNLPDQTHKKMETRRALRHARRFRKTPRRPKRFNNRRHGRRYWIAPSQLAKVQARLKAVRELCKIYPVERIVVENVRHHPKLGKGAHFFSTAEIGKTMTLLELHKLAPVTVVESKDTAVWRRQFGFVKIHGSRRPEVFEAQAVDAAAMLMGTTGCALGSPPFYVFTALRAHRRQLHKAKPQKGGVRPPYGGTSNGTFFRKGDWVEVTARKGRLRGWVCGLPTPRTPKVGVAGPDGERIAQFGLRQVRLLARAGGFTWRREGVALPLSSEDDSLRAIFV